MYCCCLNEIESITSYMHLFTVKTGENIYMFKIEYLIKKDTANIVKYILGGCIIFKSRDITLPTKVRLVKAMVFPVVMYGCENWPVKKAER